MPQLSPAMGSMIFLSTVLLFIVLIISTRDSLPPQPASKTENQKPLSSRTIF